jgi:hypothetical protein
VGKKTKKQRDDNAVMGTRIFNKPLGVPNGQEGAALLTEGRFGKSEQKFQLSIVSQFTTSAGAEMLAAQSIDAILQAVEFSGGSARGVVDKFLERANVEKT